MPQRAGDRVAKRRLHALAILLIPLVLVIFSGCAVVKATQQPDKKDLGILNPGVPRTHVIAELGSPVWSEERDGAITDVFSFKQGYSKPVKAGRALAHGAADAFTLGLWEIVGVPVETLADGTDVQLEVRYDANRMVESVVVIRGEEAIGRPVATASKPQQTASRIDQVGRK